MSSVITLYCCGSGSHRGKEDKYAVPFLFSKDRFGHTEGAGRTCKSYICDGPGGAPVIQAESILQQIESGKGTQKKRFGFSYIKNIKQLFTNTAKSHGGTKLQAISGNTTQDNIVLCLQFLWLKIFETGSNITAINMVGWSRGGVTCIMLAHAIKESGMLLYIPNVKINVFTFDPVPGGVNDFNSSGNKTFDSTGRCGSPYKLSSCVTNYASIVQENMGYGLGNRAFKCTVPTPEMGCNADIKLYPLPGEHGSGCSYQKESNPVGIIGLHLAYSFLRENGTEFMDSFAQTPIELIELYALARKKYVKKNSSDKLSPTKFRKKLIHNTKREHPFYMNEHHYELIATHFPEVGNFIDGKPVQNDVMTLVKVMLPNTYQVFTFLSQS